MKLEKIFFAGAVLYLSAILYYLGIWNVKGFVGDEAYHIPSAYKYVARCGFKEPHPPTGKLLLSSLDQVLKINKDVNGSVYCDDLLVKKNGGFEKDPAKTLSVWVYRVPSATAGVLTVLIFFFLLYEFSKSSVFASIGALLLLFDTVLLISFRYAFIDSFLALFTVLFIFLFYKYLNSGKSGVKELFLLSIAAGLAASVKATGLILLIPLSIFALRLLGFERGNLFKKTAFYVISIFAGTAIPILLSYYVHFGLSQHASDAAARNFHMSEKYREIVAGKEGWNPKHFLFMLKENLLYSAEFERKLSTEKRPHPERLLWAFGKDPMIWALDDDSDQKKTYKMIASVANVAVWLLSVAGFLWGAAYMILSFARRKFDASFFFVSGLTLSYAGYMFVISFLIYRPMYIYHYIPPAIFGLVTFLFLCYNYIVKKIESRLFLSFFYTLFVLYAAISGYAYLPFVYGAGVQESGMRLRDPFGFLERSVKKAVESVNTLKQKKRKGMVHEGNSRQEKKWGLRSSEH